MTEPPDDLRKGLALSLDEVRRRHEMKRFGFRVIEDRSRGYPLGAGMREGIARASH
jgi:hypothetical protein